MKTIFAISDIHGHYQETLDALKEAGWDETNPDHLLIVCGDIFDRGEYSLEIFQWLYPLTQDGKAVVICGNHEPMFIEWLKGPVTNFNFLNNGMSKTIDSFDERTSSFISWIMIDKGLDAKSITDELWYEWSQITRDSIKENFPELLPWLESLPNYYETQNYIFTHGMIDGMCDDWHYPQNGWIDCAWAKPDDFLSPIMNADKKVVVGHIHCGLLRKLYQYKIDEDDNSIFERPDGKIIAIDTCTILTKMVNVLKIEKEELLCI